MRNMVHRLNPIVILAGEYAQTLEALHYSPRSVDAYRKAVGHFATRCEKQDVSNITREDLEKYRAELLERGVKTSSVSVYMRGIRLFFKHLEARQVVFVNPAEGVGMIKEDRRLQPVPSEEEMRILLSQPDTTRPGGIRDRAFLETMYSSGARKQETLNMTVSCLDLENGRARITGKGNRQRVIPLGEQAVRWLKAWLEERKRLAGADSGDALWLAQKGTPMTSAHITQVLFQYSKAPGITSTINFHAIRRACASHMLSRGASPMAVQVLLGHATTKHLSRYLKVTNADIMQEYRKTRVGQ